MIFKLIELKKVIITFLFTLSLVPSCMDTVFVKWYYICGLCGFRTISHSALSKNKASKPKTRFSLIELSLGFRIVFKSRKLWNLK
ncbi:MAG: hypothetical protein IPL26_07220 [Leptospiraceae bacterium]|nr:hypothetical protein [Leptospiraceae bacterium]